MTFLLIAVLFCVTPPVQAAAQTPSTPSDPLSLLPGDTIVAMVGDEPIRLSDLEAYSHTKDPKRLFQLNQQLFEFRQSMLGLMLGERLLRLEAEKAGMTIEELLDARLEIADVTETEIQEVISRQAPGSLDPALVKPLIKQYLVERKKEDARARYIADLVAKARKAPRPLVTALQPPRQAVAVLDSDPTNGTGPIELIEFSDFECPFCQKIQPVLREILAKFEGKVKHVWKDYPLPIHESAVQAAAAARCAHEQGRFWQYHDLLFAHQQELAPENLKQHARLLKLDTDAFDACLDGDKYRGEIAAALKAASAYTVPATPTIFINGRIITGVAPVELYARIIAEELGN